jgi:two-component system, cell cycle sensor histidine kinase and response regulator CckA
LVRERLSASADVASAPDLHYVREELVTAEEELQEQSLQLAQLNERVQSERRRHIELFESAPDGYFITDLFGVVSEANRAAGALLQLGAAQMRGKPLVIFVDPADRQRFRTVVREAARTRVTQQVTLDLQSTRRSRFAVVLRVAALCGEEGGAPTALAWLAREEAPADEGLVSGASAADARLLRLQRFESLGVLISGVVHDLNNVLSPILMSAQRLRRDGAEEERPRLFDALEGNTIRAAALVGQMLAFARGEPAEPVLLQPRQVLQDVITLIKESLPRSIGLALQAEATWNVRAEPTQMHQVLLNLCLNARDAMPEGGTLTLRVRNVAVDEAYAAMRPESRPGRYVAFEVQDTGAGIAPDIMERIFEPFFTTKANGEGTGLGLSTVETIIRGHRGFVEVENAGPGTRFRVHFPACVGPAGLAALAEAAPTADRRGNGETILVADDEPLIRDLVADTLKGAGYNVITAADGAEALALFARDSARVALVLTDIDMPVMDGLHTIHALRHIAPAARIVVMSGVPDDDETLAGDARIAAFVRKPFRADELLVQIERALLDVPTSECVRAHSADRPPFLDSRA